MFNSSGLISSGKTGGGVSDFLTSQTNWTALNTAYPPATNSGKFCYVINGETGALGMYLHPKGFYYSTGSAWVQDKRQVNVSQDTNSIVNITNWANFYASTPAFNIGDEVKYNGIVYTNTTASFTSTAPDTDGTNWGSFIDFETNLSSDPSSQEGRVWWNKDKYTLNVDTGQGPVLQVGQEEYFIVYNNTGSQIDNGAVVHPIGSATAGNPNIEKANASVNTGINRAIWVTTMDIPNGSKGIATSRGVVSGINTSAFSVGDNLWVSDTVAGALVNTAPQFPSYAVQIGGVAVSDTSGSIVVSVKGDVEDTILNTWDGSIRESFDFRTSSNGTVITGTLTNPNATHTDLTLMFSTGFHTFSCSTIGTVPLTAGTSTNPQMNYIYIPESTKVLTVSETGFPATEHCKIAKCYLQDASSVETYGALRNQNINDHIKSDNDNGHLLHIAERVRQLNASWNNGTLGTLTGTTSNVYINTTEGQVWQMHKQTFPAQSMATGDDIHVVNDPVTPYKPVTNLNVYTDYSTGSSNNNDWSNLVVWGVANKTGEISHLMVNLPRDGYNTESNAINDRNSYTNYSIPTEFKGVGFLIGRFTIRRSGSVFTYNSGTGYLDLRGFFPNNTAGGSAGSSGITDFTGLTDTPSSYSGEAGKVLAVNSGESAVEFTDTINGNFTITGNLTVNGDKIIQNVEELDVEANTILLNNGETGAGVSSGYAGLIIDRGTANNYALLHRESDDTGRYGEFTTYSNTAQAGASTTITLDAGASAVDDYYNTMLIKIIGGTGAGQTNTITDYVGSSKVATVSAWATNPDNTSIFEIITEDSTLALSLREDTPTNNAIARWDSATSKFITSSNLVFDGSVFTITKTSPYGTGSFKIKNDAKTKELFIGFVDTYSAGSIQAMHPTVSPLPLLLNAQGGGIGIGTTIINSLVHMKTTGTDDGLTIEAGTSPFIKLVDTGNSTIKIKSVSDDLIIDMQSTSGAFTILDNGNAGFGGTPETWGKLHVEIDDSSGAVYVKNTDSTSSVSAIFRIDSNSSLTNAFRVQRDGVVRMAGLPTSASGLSSGDLWNNSGVVNIV